MRKDKVTRYAPWHTRLARWQRTARELASNRIDRQITDPADPGVRPGDHALARSISDTRATLGLDLPAAGHDHDHDQGIN
jgi:hypothetical protein